MNEKDVIRICFEWKKDKKRIIERGKAPVLCDLFSTSYMRQVDENQRLRETLNYMAKYIRSVQHKLYKLSDLQDNMEHWIKMQEMSEEISEFLNKL